MKKSVKSNPHLIGLSGKASSGKDTVAKIINYILTDDDGVIFGVKDFIECYEDDTEIYPFRSVKFAAKLKMTMQMKFPEHFSVRRWESEGNEYRNEYLNDFEMTRRELLIAEGDGLRNVVHKDYWVIATMGEYREGHDNWIMTDMRYPNEYDAIKSLGGITIRIERDGIDRIDSHTETLLDLHSFDYTIMNDGNLDQLTESVWLILSDLKLI